MTSTGDKPKGDERTPWTHPSVWALVDEVSPAFDASTAPGAEYVSAEGNESTLMLRLLAAEEDAFAPEDACVPGLATITGMHHEIATAGEAAAWALHLETDPGAGERADTFSAFVTSSDDASASLVDLLHSGERLFHSLSPLPAALQSDTAEAFGQGAMPWEEAATSIDDTHRVGEDFLPANTPLLGAPEALQTSPLASSSSASFAALWQVGLGMLACVCLLWVGGGAPVWDAPGLVPSPGQRVVPLGPLQASSKGGAIKVPVKATTPNLHFDFFVRRQGTIRKIQASYQGAPGDQLRFSYHYRAAQAAPKPLFLLLFMLDRKGQVSHLYPADPRGTFRLEATAAGPDVLLPTGATLDQIEGPERLFVCVTTRRLPYELAHASLKAALQRRGVASIARLPAALGCLYQRTWLLRPGGK